MTFKQGDTIRCTDPGYCFITKGQEYTALEDVSGGSVYIRDDDGDRSSYSVSDFELVRSAAEQKGKLRLPLVFTSTGTSNVYAMSAGDEGKVTLVGVDDGTLYKNHCTEDEAIRYLSAGTWVMKGKGSKPANAALVQAVTDAKAALATAEAALANHKPYLA